MEKKLYDALLDLRYALENTQELCEEAIKEIRREKGIMNEDVADIMGKVTDLIAGFKK